MNIKNRLSQCVLVQLVDLDLDLLLEPGLQPLDLPLFSSLLLPPYSLPML